MPHVREPRGHRGAAECECSGSPWQRRAASPLCTARCCHRAACAASPLCASPLRLAPCSPRAPNSSLPGLEREVEAAKNKTGVAGHRGGPTVALLKAIHT